VNNITINSNIARVVGLVVLLMLVLAVAPPAAAADWWTISDNKTLEEDFNDHITIGITA
jgi:hypothetical protein